MKQEYTISIFARNHIGLLSRIANGFTRRKLIIEGLTISESAVTGIVKCSVVINSSRKAVENLVKQLEKQIDIIRAYYATRDEMLYQEVALYKLATTSLIDTGLVEEIIRHFNAKIIEMTQEYTIVEKTGLIEDIEELLERLKPYGVLQFSRSGRIAVTRWKNEHSVSLSEKPELCENTMVVA